MGGICGIVNWDGAPVDPELLRKMAEATAYRGPDGIRYWIEGNVGFAHLALRATPESVREEQPLLNDRGDLVLTADARVDNRQELIRSLTARGVLLQADPTDADLILSAYECWGAECAKRVVGDFALAVWDRREQQLVCLRDPLGVKPLHWARVQNIFCFASEAQQILQHPAVPRRLDQVAVAEHLMQDYRDQERTMFLDVKGLPPAHRLIVTDSRLRKERYWEADSGVRIVYKDDGEYASHFLDLFRQAVAAQLRSRTRTVGILMSGGLDSTSIAAVAQAMYRENRHVPKLVACSYAFDEVKECDERAYSQIMATELGVEIEYIDVESFPLITHQSHVYPDLETPFLRWAAANEHALGVMKQRGIKVAFAGTAPFYTRLGGSSTVFPHRLLSFDIQVVRELANYARTHSVPAHRVLYRDLLHPLFPEPLKPVARRLLRRNRPSAVPEWITPSFAQQIKRHRWLVRSPSTLRLSQSVQSQQSIWSGGVSRESYYRDRMAARCGLEARAPFLDRRVVDFLMAIPPKYGYQPGLNRWILREAMREILPDALRLRHAKTVFFPFYQYRLCSQEHQQVKTMFRNSILSTLGIVDEPELHRAYAEMQAGSRSVSELWPAITLEMWLRRYYGAFSSEE